MQLPLEKGNAVFFNPSLFHAAGENVGEDIERLVNLVQVSSAFGRTMESIDRMAMSQAILLELVAPKQVGRLFSAEVAAALAARADDAQVLGIRIQSEEDHPRRTVAVT